MIVPNNFQCLTDHLLSPEISAAGVGNKHKLWPTGSTLTVEFWGGTPQMHAAVIKHALEMRVNLHYEWRIQGKGQSGESGTASLPEKLADIRISFIEGAGSWSFIGMDALKVGPNAATMNFGWLAWAFENGNLNEVRRVIQHEWLHLLGVKHEQHHIHCPFVMNETGYQYFESIGWTREQAFRTYMLKFPVEKSALTPYNEKSLSLYWALADHDLHGRGLPYNDSMSQGDYDWIQRYYGLLNKPQEPRIITPTIEGEKSIYIPLAFG